MDTTSTGGTATVYYEEPYRTELDCSITNMEPKGSQYLVELDRTIFYPEGGGQPTDQGELTGAAGKFRVDQVRVLPDGRIVHQGTLSGTLKPGDAVHATLKWAPRLKNMRVHAAGHLVHDVLMSIAPGLVPTKGNHGSKAFLEYTGTVDAAVTEGLESKVNEVLSQDLPIATRESDYYEISEKCKFVPPGLPKHKKLRIIQIGTFDMMPDGGVHVKATKEIGGVVIHGITSDSNKVVIRYGVKHGAEGDAQ